jgi:hypothetical protein
MAWKMKCKSGASPAILRIPMTLTPSTPQMPSRSPPSNTTCAYTSSAATPLDPRRKSPTPSQPQEPRLLRVAERVCCLLVLNSVTSAVDTPARGRVVVCLVFVYLVCVCKYVLGHSRVSQPLNLRLCLLRQLGFLTSPYASPTCRRLRLNSYRLFRRFTPDPPPIPWAHLLHLPASPRPPLYTSTMKT